MPGPVGAAARLNFALRLDATATAPRPRGPQSVVTGAPDAVRVLLLGNGPASGWGVTSQKQALTGALAERLGEWIGAPVDVDLVGDETMNVASALPWIGRRSLDGYAGAVVVIGTNDALRLAPLQKWRTDLDRLLDALEDRLHPAARITLAGIQPVRTVQGFDGPFGLLGQRHADRLNDVSRAVAADHQRVDWTPMPAPPRESSRSFGSPETYVAWAAHLALTAGPPLAGAADLVPWTPARADGAGQLAPGGRGLVDGSAPSHELRALAEQAKRTLRVDAAMITLLTDEEQFFAASTTAQPNSVPRELTYCDSVVRDDAPLVVPDARRDPRFQDNAFINLTHLPFYAGVPLHDADGAAIGTFCVFSALPKSGRRVDMAALQSLAREAELELRSRLGAATLPITDDEDALESGWAAVRLAPQD